MSLSPTQLTLRHLRDSGEWPAIQVVEVWNPHARRRVDLFGIIDVLAVGPAGTLAVQTTSANNVSSRVRKIAEAEVTDSLLDAGWQIVVHGWRKRSGKWELHREVELHEVEA